MQNALIKNLPIETAAKISAANNAHWPNVDEAPPVHHVNCGIEKRTCLEKRIREQVSLLSFGDRRNHMGEEKLSPLHGDEGSI